MDFLMVRKLKKENNSWFVILEKHEKVALL
jgi:hypothetical protein